MENLDQSAFITETDEIHLLHIHENIVQGLESDGAIQRREVQMEGFFWLNVFSFMDYAHYK